MDKKVLFNYNDIRDICREFDTGDRGYNSIYDAMINYVNDKFDKHYASNPYTPIYIRYVEKGDEEDEDEYFEGLVVGRNKRGNPPLIVVHFPEGSEKYLRRFDHKVYETMYEPKSYKDSWGDYIFPNVWICGEYSHRIVEIYTVDQTNQMYAKKLQRWDD